MKNREVMQFDTGKYQGTVSFNSKMPWDSFVDISIVEDRIGWGFVWCKTADGSIQFKETRTTDTVTSITVIRGEVDEVKALIKEVLDETHPSYSFL